MKPKAIWLIGPPGSGKSTFTKQFLEKTTRQTLVVSLDALVETWAKENCITYTEAWENFDWNNIVDCKELAVFSKSGFLKFLENSIYDAINEKKDVIIDMTNLDSRKYLEIFPDTYYKEAVIFEISTKKLFERLINRERLTGKHVPDFIVRSMINSYIPPNENDFDLIRVVKQ